MGKNGQLVSSIQIKKRNINSDIIQSCNRTKIEEVDRLDNMDWKNVEATTSELVQVKD